MIKQNQRFNFFVSPRFQLMMICFSFFLIAAVFSFYYFLQNFYFIEAQKALNLVEIDSKDVFIAELNSLESSRDKSLLAVFAALSLLSVTYMLFLSHKIAGPIYKTIQWLKIAKFGESIRFRNGDYFQELSVEINKFSELKSKNK
jgi:hypothetical protein